MAASEVCYRHVERVPVPEANSGITAAADAKLRIHGMVCPNCAARVYNALVRLEGVAEVEVWLRPPVAAVRFDSARVSLSRLLSAVAAAGVGSGRHYRAIPLYAQGTERAARGGPRAV